MIELVIVLKSVKLKKAAELDDIPPEVWKTGLFNAYLLNFCNDVYIQSTIDEWRKGCILPCSKKVDRSKPENYRGITLTYMAAKIYNTMLRNRI